MSDLKVEVVDTINDLKEDNQMIEIMLKDVVITNANEYASAQIIGKSASESIKNIKAYFAPIKEQTNNAHKKAVAMEKDFLAVPEEAKSKIKRMMIDYENEQERIRREKEAKLRREFEAKQEQERLAREAEMAKLKESGIENPEEIFQEEVSDFTAEDIYVEPVFQKTGSTIDNWKGEVVELERFFKWVFSEGKFEFIMPNQTAINKYIKATSGEDPLAGVRIYNDQVKKF